MTFALPTLDFRSDTVTRPDDTMRAAMASAEVGDNVLERDPTVAALEERAAHVLGMPAALWVPSGTMANLIALSLHLQRGDRFLATRGAHVLTNELGSAAWLAGGMPDILEHDGGPGRPSPDALATAIGQPGPYFTLRTTLLCLENTHNAAGGAVTPPDEHAQLLSVAKEAGLTVHLDGARLWQAAVALEVPPAALTVGVDSVSACFSKGLGAPVGSVVAGSAEFVERARRMRQMLGGGVRQGGILAAACLIALDRVPDLAESHENARRLAEGLREHGWPTNDPDTNIVLAEVADVPTALTWLDSIGIQAVPMAGRVRFVTHRDLSAADVEEALRRLKTGA
ncbi:GntG family PLP-dependent aldolase [Amycolatopsis sp. NPDC051128]|uniref:threonine aldolase family protein n=1 Tax=Amycolatopsis sp. NPDC051128 TaxID=3155412 RepID=UPI00343A733F